MELDNKSGKSNQSSSKETDENLAALSPKTEAESWIEKVKIIITFNIV